MTHNETEPEDFFDPDLAELETLSNGVLDRIESGLLDEAERMCLDLKARFPDTIDWIEHSAAIHEARGNIDKAVEHYRRCLAYIDRHPDDFDEEVREGYQERIDRLHDSGR
jgi:tetratricopeptide (TPR) repeat protein